MLTITSTIVATLARHPTPTAMVAMTHGAAEGRRDTPGIAGCRKFSRSNHGQTILSPVTGSGNRALTW